MKKIKVMALALALVLLLAACGQQSATNGKTGLRASEKPFVKVAGEEVSTKEFYAQYDLFAGVMALQQGLNQRISSMVVTDKFIQQDLKANNVEISEEDYQKEIDAAIAQIGGEEEFNKYLDFMGTTADVFKANIRNNFNNTKHLEWFTSNFKATDEQLSKYYEENKNNLDYVEARHILVKTEDEAKDIIKKLESKEKTFEELNDELSLDAAAKTKGGSLGRITKTAAGQYDPKFLEATYRLEKNQISEPVSTQVGYHIIEVTDKAEGLDAHKDKIVEALASQEHQVYLDNKLKEIDIVFYDDKGLPIVNPETPEGETQTPTTDVEKP